MPTSECFTFDILTSGFMHYWYVIYMLYVSDKGMLPCFVQYHTILHILHLY